MTMSWKKYFICISWW